MIPMPDRGRRFTVKGWTPAPGRPEAVAFHYHCDVHGDFTEIARFSPAALPSLGMMDDGLQSLLTLFGMALGVSYYKLAAAPVIRVPSMSAAGIALAEGLYGPGLAEFAVRAGLPVTRALTIEADAPSTEAGGGAFADMPAPGHALVAFGGGKDSHVALRILDEAGTDVSLVSVILSEAVGAVLTATAPSPPRLLRRALDPRLPEATERGFGGHIPITAINTLMLTIEARLTGASEVVFANERSADEPTMVLADGQTANHQWSKSSDAEGMMRAAIAACGPGMPHMYSVLRPFSELWIGRAFAEEKGAFGRFTSCNRNFRLAGDATRRWCGACAKCAFTSLILAPFLDEAETHAVFGAAFLDAPALQPYYADLLGLSDRKPWDCVGTIEECRAALWATAKRTDPRPPDAVRRYLPRLSESIGEDGLAAAWAAALAVHERGAVPASVYDAALRLGSASAARRR